MASDNVKYSYLFQITSVVLFAIIGFLCRGIYTNFDTLSNRLDTLSEKVHSLELSNVRILTILDPKSAPGACNTRSRTSDIVLFSPMGRDNP